MIFARRAVAALVLVVATVLASAPALAGDSDTPLGRVTEASQVLQQMMQAPDNAMPHNMLRNAYAIAILPNVIKAGLVVAARRGHGVIAIKKDGVWSNPAFITVTGGSIGLQAGVSSTDVLLIFRSQRGVDSIIYGKFTLGTDLSVAAGPVGRSAQASTDAQLHAEIYAYSRSRGLFAGLSFQGAVLRMDDAANAAIYGTGVTPKRIFAGDVGPVPAAVVTFRDALEEYTAQ